MHRHRFGTKLEGGPVRMTRWQDDTSHDNSSHHGQNSSRFLEAWLKKQIIFPDFALYSVAVMIVCPSHWDTVISKLSKKVNYTLSPPDIYLLVPCPGCPMSSYNNGGWEAEEGHGNDANHDHSQIWQYAPHFSETVTQTQQNSQYTIYWTSEWYFLFEYLLDLHINESYLFCCRRWWWYSNDHSSDRFWWKMLSILVNNGSFLGHLTLRSIAKSVGDGGEGNQTAMSSHAQLWGMYQWAESLVRSSFLPTSCIMTIFAIDQDSMSQIQASRLVDVILCRKMHSIRKMLLLNIMLLYCSHTKRCWLRFIAMRLWIIFTQ